MIPDPILFVVNKDFWSEKSDLFHEVEDMKSWCYEKNYNLQK